MNAPPYDLERLLARAEDQYFDRKSLWDGPPGNKKTRDRRKVRDEIAEYVAAFANADGGILVMGVEDDGTPTGHGYPDEAIEDFLATPQRRLNPAQPAGERVTYQNHELLLFSAESAPRAIMVTGDGFPRRCGDQVILESEEVINAIKTRNRRESYEQESCPEVGFDELDHDLIRRTAKAAGLGDLSVQEYLCQRRLADWRGEDLVLRRGAVLLFARRAHAIDHPNAGVRIFRVDGTERLTGPRHNVQELPRVEAALPVLIERVHSAISGLIHRSARLHDLFFREMPEYPDFAWQEAIVNAVAHRDYRTEGRCVEVWLFDDRLEVHSPGSLLPEVELSRLQRRERIHVSRNPRITHVLAELNIMREQGEGIPRIFEEMEQSWLPLPELAGDSHSFTITLRNTPIFDIGDPRWAEYVHNLPLNNRQRRILVAYRGSRFASADYQHLNQVDRDTAYRELRELVEMGLISSPSGRGRKARYEVAVEKPLPESERERTARQMLSRVMRTAGSIKNADYRTCFKVNRQQAKRELAELVQAGVLRLEGERRGAYYAPGPAWGEWVSGAQLSH